MTVVDGGDVRICVRDFGGDGPPMVCLHGAGGNIAAFEELAVLLRGAVRVIAYDQRAYGESGDSDDLSLAAYVRDLGAVIAALELEDPIVYGQSFGACVGLEYAVTHGCMGFVNEDGPYMSHVEYARRAGIAPQPLEEVDADHRSQHFIGSLADLDRLLTSLGLTGTPFEAMLRRRMQPRQDGMLESRPRPEQLTRLVEEYRWHTERLDDLYAGLQVPALYFAASHDEHVGLKREALAELPARLRLEWLPTGHTVSLERADLVAEIVCAFVEGL